MSSVYAACANDCVLDVFSEERLLLRHSASDTHVARSARTTTYSERTHLGYEAIRLRSKVVEIGTFEGLGERLNEGENVGAKKRRERNSWSRATTAELEQLRAALAAYRMAVCPRAVLRGQIMAYTLSLYLR